jgi:hypothetical protein
VTRLKISQDFSGSQKIFRACTHYSFVIRVILFTLVLAIPALSNSWARCEYCEHADAVARKHAAAAALRAFQRLHPCPATHSQTGACPGWTVDHLFPRICGGADSPSNMYWQTTQEMAIKAREETIVCLGRKH